LSINVGCCLQRSEGECHTLKQQLTQMEETLTKETQLLKKELNDVELDLHQVVKVSCFYVDIMQRAHVILYSFVIYINYLH